MNRRGFIRISSVAILPVLLGLFPKTKAKGNYSIKVVSNRKFGHLLRQTAATKPTRSRKTDVVIVGGGVAGIAAAFQLKDSDFLVFEGSDRLGGSSASGNWKSAEFAMGAHYELAYPQNFGTAVITMLEELGVLKLNTLSGLYEFTEKKYVIKPEVAEQCFVQGEKVEDVLANSPGEDEFYDFLARFEGEMPLPTRLIHPKHHALNTVTFANYLTKHIPLSAELKRRIDYQMLDDWGATSDQVSALAGVHYYTCRPYNTKAVELFSPPNGNAYLVEKMIGNINKPQAFHTNTFVRSIIEHQTGVTVEVLHQNGDVESIEAKSVVYAGQKHALNYVFPAAANLFNAAYSPWVVLNFVCKKGVNFEKWQNDVLTDQLSFLGFVNSAKQHSRSDEYDVFTAYYCFTPEERKKLVAIETDPEHFIKATIQLIENETQTNFSDALAHVNIHLMGHAMPIPSINYLALSNTPPSLGNVVFAGVDTGRLPLFSEAADSGLLAGKFVQRKLNKSDNSLI